MKYTVSIQTYTSQNQLPFSFSTSLVCEKILEFSILPSYNSEIRRDSCAIIKLLKMTFLTMALIMSTSFRMSRKVMNYHPFELLLQELFNFKYIFYLKVSMVHSRIKKIAVIPTDILFILS